MKYPIANQISRVHSYVLWLHNTINEKDIENFVKDCTHIFTKHEMNIDFLNHLTNELKKINTFNPLCLFHHIDNEATIYNKKATTTNHSNLQDLIVIKNILILQYRLEFAHPAYLYKDEVLLLISTLYPYFNMWNSKDNLFIDSILKLCLEYKKKYAVIEPINTGVNPMINTLQQRKSRYGEYKQVCLISQEVKEIFKTALQSESIKCNKNPVLLETIDMVSNKIARIENGETNYYDSWYDIAGYITLLDNYRKGIST